jgi:Mn-containing catalase
LALFGHGATPGLSLYTTAKNLAQQLRHSAVVSLVSKSLAEGENADQLLNQVARTLMSVAKMPQAMEQCRGSLTIR